MELKPGAVVEVEGDEYEISDVDYGRSEVSLWGGLDDKVTVNTALRGDFALFDGNEQIGSVSEIIVQKF